MRSHMRLFFVWLLTLELVLAPQSYVYAQTGEKSQPTASIEGQAPVLATLIQGAGTRDVVENLLEQDPDAKVFVPPEENKKLSEEKTIVHEPPNALNTLLIAIQFSNTNIVYLVSDHLTWLQSMAMVAGNIYLLNQFTLRLGAWPRVMQWSGKKIRAGAELAGVSNPKTLDRVETLGNFATHWALCYFTYGLMTFLSHLPDFRAGLVSWEAQKSIFLKATLGFASAFGWSMLSRKWDAMENDKRPIGRQAFTTFQYIRTTTVGFFIPALVISATSLSIVEFFIANPVFVVSAVVGGVFYFGADPLLRRFPQIERSMNRFEMLTQRIDKQIIKARDACYPFLRSLHTTVL